MPAHRMKAGSAGLGRWWAPALVVGALTACNAELDLDTLTSAVHNHWAVLSDSRPVADVLTDPEVPDDQKKRLERAMKMRAFAFDVLKLPYSHSYTRYTERRTAFVIWRLAATPELSLELENWCFVATGCLGAKPYFSEQAAQAEGRRLRALGWEVSVQGGVSYSTRGRFDWFMGDPLIGPMVRQPEGWLAASLFGELAHGVLHLDDDPEINESMAHTIGRLGSQQWLQAHGSSTARLAWEAYLDRQDAAAALTLQAHRRLQKLYDVPRPDGVSQAEFDTLVRQEKATVLAELRQQYAQVREGWGGSPELYRDLDQWVTQANNAALAALAAKERLAPAFERMFVLADGDWPRFIDSIGRLRSLSREQRHRMLASLM